jgi:pimeloyl-ACP methyl ester carboxylesterase
MSFGEIGGPIGCLGVAMLLAATGPRARVAGLVLVGLGASLLGAEVTNAQPTAVALGVFAVVLASVPVALLLRRWPWILAFAVLPAVPARIPLDLGASHSQLELPLYLLAGAAGFQIALDIHKGDRRSRELGPLALPLAAFRSG